MTPIPAPDESLPTTAELDAFERELRAFQPAAPSAQATAGIRAELGDGARAKIIAFPSRLASRLSPLAWTAAAAAAAVTIAAAAAWLWPRPTSESAPPRFGGPVVPAVSGGNSVVTASTNDPQWRQVRADTEWEGTTDEGIVTAPGDPAAALAMHRLRGVFRDTLEWQDARSGAVLTIQYPREEFVAQAAGPF